MTNASSDTAVPPNHHADHPGFSGIRGAVSAVLFLFKRQEAAQLAADLAGVSAGDRVVDIGCGPGFAANRARSLGADVVGVDPAPVMLRVARLRWRGHGRVSWREGTAEAIPVERGWATVVWSLATVHHWRDLDTGLDEVERVLGDGGRFVVLEREITDPLADGVAGHGWTTEQAEAFAAACRRHGWADVAVGSHRAPGPVLSVVARS